jgi:L-lactate dehydrogenase complex protein LldG
MTSRQSILSSIRGHRPAAAELPDLNEAWSTYPDCRQQFVQMLTAVGGQAYVATDKLQMNDELQQLPVYASAKKIVSLVPGVGESNVDIAPVDSPHALADIDVAILPGEFAVAENAAVWVTDQNIPLRVIYFLCQHLVLVVPADEIVDHMHAAYARLSTAGPSGGSIFGQPIFGAFISGPSKTADIEQSLVIGAHGPRSLTVFLLETDSRLRL